jgi:predicted dinucleotide-utilizing enzyme
MSTFEPMEFKNWQRQQLDQVKLINIKPGKENYHVKIVKDVLHSLYPHPNDKKDFVYDSYMEKAVKKFQQDINTPITGRLTDAELRMLAEKSGKFRVV